MVKSNLPGSRYIQNQLMPNQLQRARSNVCTVKLQRWPSRASIRHHLIAFIIALVSLPPPTVAATKPCTSSTLLLPLHVSMKAISTQVNTIMPKSLSGRRDNPKTFFHDSSITWSMSRGSIDLQSAYTNVLYAKTQISGTATLKGRLLVFPFRETTDRLRAEVTASIMPILTKNWRIQPNFHAYVHLNEVSGKLLSFIPYDVPGLFQKRLNDVVNKEVLRINAAIMNNSVLQEKARKFWSNLHRAIKVNSQPSVWLSIRPKRISGSQPHFNNRGAYLTIGVVADTDLSVEEKPPVISTTALPTLTLVNQQPQGSLNLVLPITVKWDTANKLIAKQLMREPPVIEKGSARLIFERVTLAGRDEGKMIVTTQFSVHPTGFWGWALTWIDRLLSAVGLNWKLSNTLDDQIVEIAATPRLDNSGKNLSVHEPTLTASSSDLVQMATDVYEWITSKTIEDWIEQTVTVKLPEEIVDLKGIAQGRLNKFTDELSKRGVKMKSHLQNIKRLPLEVTSDALLTKVCADAKLSVELTQLNLYDLLGRN